MALCFLSTSHPIVTLPILGLYTLLSEQAEHCSAGPCQALKSCTSRLSLATWHVYHAKHRTHYRHPDGTSISLWHLVNTSRHQHNATSHVLAVAVFSASHACQHPNPCHTLASTRISNQADPCGCPSTTVLRAPSLIRSFTNGKPCPPPCPALGQPPKPTRLHRATTAPLGTPIPYKG